MADAAGQDSARLRGRKRLCFQEDWKRKKRKILKDSGKEYTTYKGDNRPEKVPPSIACRCGLKCSVRVGSVEQQLIFDKFMMSRTSTCTDLLKKRV